MVFLIISIRKEKDSSSQEISVLPGKGGYLWIFVPCVLIILDHKCCSIELFLKDLLFTGLRKRIKVSG